MQENQPMGSLPSDQRMEDSWAESRYTYYNQGCNSYDTILRDIENITMPRLQ